MNWLDILLLLILAASVIGSFRSGFTREVIGLASLVLAIVLAAWFYGLAGGWLLPYVSSRSIANFCGFAIMFTVVMMAGSLIGFIVARMLKIAGLSPLDRLLGAGFGAIKGVLIAIALVLAILAFSPGSEPPRSVVRSRFAPYVIEASHVVASIAPHELKDGFRRKYEQVKDLWHEALKKKGIRQASGREKAENENRI